jgi:hypothetical protein
MRTKTPTNNQARRIAAALNATRIRKDNTNCAPFCCVVDDGELFVGIGDGPGQVRATTWAEAQTVVHNAECGQMIG